MALTSTWFSIIINLIFLLLGVIIGYSLHGYPPFERTMQRMDKSIRDYVKHNILWYKYGIISILFGISLYYLSIPKGDVLPIVTLLGIIPILLAAIFSLFFTTIFVIAQMMTRGYVKVFNIMGDKFRIVSLSYFVGIIFPILVLKSGYNIFINILEEFGVGNSQITNLSITTSITITIFCILIVFDYLQDMREFMRKDAIPRLIKEALEAIDKDKEGDAEEITKELLSLFR